MVILREPTQVSNRTRFSPARKEPINFDCRHPMATAVNAAVFVVFLAAEALQFHFAGQSGTTKWPKLSANDVSRAGRLAAGATPPRHVALPCLPVHLSLLLRPVPLGCTHLPLVVERRRALTSCRFADPQHVRGPARLPVADHRVAELPLACPGEDDGEEARPPDRTPPQHRATPAALQAALAPHPRMRCGIAVPNNHNTQPPPAAPRPPVVGH